MMRKSFCDDCGVEITKENSTHRNGAGQFVLTGIFVTFSQDLHYCDACLLHKFQLALSPD